MTTSIRPAVCVAALLLAMGPLLAPSWAGEPTFSAGVVAGTSSARSPEIWSQWRGPHRDGRYLGASWPEELDGRIRPLWRVELEPSYAGPIVSEDRVFTVETRDEELEIVYAFDRDTGEELWQAEWEGSLSVPFFAARNGSWVRSTPTYDGEALYVAGMRDVLVCLEADSGEERWTVDFTERYGTSLPAFHFVCSPLVDGDHVYVQAGASMVKLDKWTGDSVWRSAKDAGGMMGSAFSSPILAPLQGERQLLALTRTSMIGVDPRDGRMLWSQEIPAFRGMNILTPLVFGDGVFTTTYGGRARLLDVGRDEQGEYQVTEAWNSRAQGYMTSPVLVGSDAYYFTRSNRFACVDLEAGETRWISGPTGDEYWSLIARQDRILALSNTGFLRLIQADPTHYDLLDEVEISESESWAHLAVAGSQLFVREQHALAAYAWE